MTAGSFSQLRASDRDRDHVLSLLQTAYVDGRLTKDEYDARAGHVLSARVIAQLDEVTCDLVAPVARPPLVAQPRRTNPMAIASLACGAGQLIFFPLTTVLAVAFGHVARQQIRRTGEGGSGLAAWGLVLGYAGLAVLAGIITIIWVIAAHVHPVPISHFRVPGPTRPPNPPPAVLPG